MAIEIDGKPVRPKKIAEAVLDVFVTIIAVMAAGAFFLKDEATLTENLPGLAVVAAVGIVVWKFVSAHKLIDK